MSSALRIKGGTIDDVRGIDLKPGWKPPSTLKRCEGCGKEKPHKKFYRAHRNVVHGRVHGGGTVHKTCGQCRETKRLKLKRANRAQGDARFQRARTARRTSSDT